MFHISESRSDIEQNSKGRGTLTAGSYSIPPNPPAAQFVSQGDAHVTTDNQIKFLHYLPVFRYLRCYNNLVKLPPSVLISTDLPILIFSTFRAFNNYSIMRSINCFGQVFLEILEITR